MTKTLIFIGFQIGAASIPKNIRNTGRAFIVIYDSTMKEGTGEGVYIQADAKEINEPDEIKSACDLQTGEWRITPQKASGNAVHRFYKASPKRIWMNDVEEDENGDYVRDIRVEMR